MAGDSWIASQRLEPGKAYTLQVEGKGDNGKPGRITRQFTTQKLTLAQQTYPSVAPLKGETVGVGMPVIVTFDVPVKNRALFERNMHVQSTPAVDGSWTWFSDREAHFRPRDFWPAHAKVAINLRLNGLPAGERHLRPAGPGLRLQDRQRAGQRRRRRQAPAEVHRRRQGREDHPGDDR